MIIKREVSLSQSAVLLEINNRRVALYSSDFDEMFCVKIIAILILSTFVLLGVFVIYFTRNLRSTKNSEVVTLIGGDLREVEIDDENGNVINVTFPVHYVISDESAKNLKLKWFDNTGRIINDSLELESDNYKISQDYCHSNLSIHRVNENSAGVYVLEAHLIDNKSGKYQKRAEKRIELIIQKRKKRTDIMSTEYVSKVTTVTWTVALVVLMFIFIIFIINKFKNKKFRRSKQRDFQKGEISKIDPNLDMTFQAEFLPYHEFFEFPVRRLRFTAQLGHGDFGVVYQAIAKGIMPYDDETVVAVKTLQDYADERSFKSLCYELKILCNIGHHLNIVNLLGAVTKNIVYKDLMLILEFCSLGNLLSFLLVNRLNFEDDLGFYQTSSEDFLNQIGKNYFGKQVRFVHKPNVYFGTSFNRKDSSVPITFDTFSNISFRAPKTSDLLSWAFQCSRGMEYLSSRNVIHGDFAARNIKLCDGNIVKISDFALSKALKRSHDKNYQKIKDDDPLPLPYKWMAIECFQERKFSHKSDVWSFGRIMLNLLSYQT